MIIHADEIFVLFFVNAPLRSGIWIWDKNKMEEAAEKVIYNLVGPSCIFSKSKYELYQNRVREQLIIRYGVYNLTLQ